MALSGFKAATGSKKLCQLEIRPESDFVWLRGPIEDAPDVKVNGTVVLMTAEPVSLKNIRVVLEGRRKTTHSWRSDKEVYNGPPVSSPIVNKMSFLRDKMEVFPGGTLPAGNHTWPFEFTLNGSTSESIEGMPANYIVYGLHANADRGLLSKDLRADRHLRVLRTLGPEEPALTEPQGLHDVWPDKVKYDLSTSTTAVMYGTSLISEIQLVPLVEKLEAQTIKFTLREKRSIKTIPGPEYLRELHTWGGMWEEREDVVSQEMEIPDDSEIVDEQTCLKGYRFKATWPLPRALSTCRQSVHHDEWISIRHRIHYDILFKNPDGHFSELKAHHAVQLYISPAMPISENSTVSNALPTRPTAQKSNGLDIEQQIPPVYQNSHLDMIFPESGLVTPGVRSGTATPFRNFSRSGSSENLSALPENSNYPSLQSAALQSRLREIQESNDRRVSRRSLDPLNPSPGAPSPEARPSTTRNYFDANRSPSGTNGDEQSRPNETPPETRHVEYDMDALRQVVSYGTAIRQPVAAPLDAAPPTYDAATCGPSRR